MQALIELLKLERLLVEKLIPSKNNVLIRSVFSQICGPALSEYKSKIDAIAKWAGDRLNKRDYKACMDMMPIADYIRMTTPTLMKMIADCNKDVRDTCGSIAASLHTVGGRMLEEFLAGVKNEPETKDHMPVDGTVHSCTSRAMHMVSSLDVFHEAVTSFNTSKPFSMVVQEVIKALFQILDKKAKHYSKAPLQNMFLLNNFNYMANACGKGNLPKIYPEGRRQCRDKADQHRKEFCKSWNKLISHFNTTFKSGEDVCRIPQLSDKQRTWLKEKFKAINAITEELCQEQRGYSVPDSDLKTRIRLDLQNDIIPIYSEFHGKVRMINFSSHQNKYMKMTPDDLSEKIDSLFDTTFI